MWHAPFSPPLALFMPHLLPPNYSQTLPQPVPVYLSLHTPPPHSSLWLSFCCYALLRVDSVRSWCSLDETLWQNANIPLRAGSLTRRVFVCVCVCA